MTRETKPKQTKLPQQILLQLFPKDDPYRLERVRDFRNRLTTQWEYYGMPNRIYVPALEYRPRQKKWQCEVTHTRGNYVYESGWFPSLSAALRAAFWHMYSEQKQMLKETQQACRTVDRQLKNPEAVIVCVSADPPKKPATLKSALDAAFSGFDDRFES